MRAPQRSATRCFAGSGLSTAFVSAVIFALMPVASSARADSSEAVALVQPNSPVSIAISDSDPSRDVVSAWLDDNTVPSNAASSVDASGEPKVVRRRSGRDPVVAQARGADGGLGAMSFSGVMWPLLAVLGTIGVLAMLARRWMAGGTNLGSGGGIRVLARHFLSNKQSLCLVRVGRRVVLLGVTPERISACADIADPDEVAGLVSAAERGAPGSFSAALSNFTKREITEIGASAPDAAEDTETVLPGRSALTGANVRDLLGRLREVSGGSNRVEHPR